jgi:competence protein ComEA
VPLSSRRHDDADVIRARLRALLAENARPGGWLPEDDVADVESPSSGADRDDEPEPTSLPAGIGRHRSPGPALRWDPGRGGARSLWAAGVLAVAVLLAWTWLDRPRVQPAPAVESAPSPAATPSVGEAAEASAAVVVSVVGLVERPGLVTVPAGARVADALQAAGGLLPDADPASVNLAAVVADGQQIAVGVPGVDPAAQGVGSGAGSGPGPVNLNSATAGELDGLPGIGPVLAQRIVEHRSQHGPFRSVDELDDVPGIGPAIAAELSELVVV